MPKIREPDAELDLIIKGLSREKCAQLLGIPEDEEVILDEMRLQIREAYCYGSLDLEDILF
jgi:hypothetical protein